MAILKFQFTALGETRQEALDEIDAAIRSVLENIGGEPWIKVTDDVKKIVIGGNILDPSSYAYLATQEVFFAGPTVLGQDVASMFRDGFRPQDQLSGGDIPF
jgi:hypothetical protein